MNLNDAEAGALLMAILLAKAEGVSGDTLAALDSAQSKIRKARTTFNAKSR